MLGQKLLPFGLMLHFASKIVTKLVNVTFCASCYILRRNKAPYAAVRCAGSRRQKFMLNISVELKRYEFIQKFVCKDIRVPIVLHLCTDWLHCLGYAIYGAAN